MSAKDSISLLVLIIDTSMLLLLLHTDDDLDVMWKSS